MWECKGDIKRERGRRDFSTFKLKEYLNHCDGMGVRFALAS
jgi:hypothetical protein